MTVTFTSCAMQASPHRDVDVPGARPHAGARGLLVTGWLLDTNILSELRRPKPERKVLVSATIARLACPCTIRGPIL